jgi:hypothetical protein
VVMSTVTLQDAILAVMQTTRQRAGRCGRWSRSLTTRMSSRPTAGLHGRPCRIGFAATCRVEASGQPRSRASRYVSVAVTTPPDRATDNSPVKRPIAVHGFVALLGVMGLGAGLATRHYVVAAAGLLFLVLALSVGYRERRSRENRQGGPSKGQLP